MIKNIEQSLMLMGANVVAILIGTKFNGLMNGLDGRKAHSIGLLAHPKCRGPARSKTNLRQALQILRKVHRLSRGIPSSIDNKQNQFFIAIKKFQFALVRELAKVGRSSSWI